MRKALILTDIDKITSKEQLTPDDVQELSEKIKELRNSETNDEESELNDIFPALLLYKEEHTEINLQKLCVEIEEFCREVYSSCRSEKEKTIYKDMVQRL